MDQEKDKKPNEKAKPQKRHRLRKTILFLFITVVVLGLTGPVWVVLATRNHVQSEGDIGLLPERDVALVLGASIRKNSTPSYFLLARLETAAELYKQGKVKKVLLSGDNRADDYNEPKVMREVVIKLGVPEADAIADFGGLDTYDSCYRAHHIFKVKSAYVVTQGYHAPRTVHTCRTLGVDSVAVGTSRYWDRYGSSVYPGYIFREIFSINKSLIELYITKPEAPVLGDPQPALP